MTGSVRHSIVSLIVFFVACMLVLRLVDVDEGRAVARAEAARYHAVNG
jgi:hypothetical protein